jgi:hypothetical protein
MTPARVRAIGSGAQVLWLHTNHMPHPSMPEWFHAYEDANGQPAGDYLGTLSQMDHQIGRLRAMLKTHNVADNTACRSIRSTCFLGTALNLTRKVLRVQCGSLLIMGRTPPAVEDAQAHSPGLPIRRQTGFANAKRVFSKEASESQESWNGQR